MREWLSWWSTTLPRSGSRVRVPFSAHFIEEAAQMAELVDALVSGTSNRKIVQVRVLFWAQKIKNSPVKRRW